MLFPMRGRSLTDGADTLHSYSAAAHSLFPQSSIPVHLVSSVPSHALLRSSVPPLKNVCSSRQAENSWKQSI